MVRISAPNFSRMRLTTGSCSARPRPLPLVDAECGGAVCGTPPGTTLSRTGRPSTPLAVAVIRRFASAPSDISITVADDPTLMSRSLPSTCHSPDSIMVLNMRCPASARAVSTEPRTTPADAAAALCGSWSTGADAGEGDAGGWEISGTGRATTAGAADPITTLAVPAGAGCDPESGLLEVESSGLDPLLRAESAANGEIFVERASDGDSDLLTSGTTDGLPAGRCSFTARPASLSNCSMG